MITENQIRSVRRGAICVNGRRYYHRELLGRSRAVMIYYDSLDTSCIGVLELNGKLICLAHEDARMHPAARRPGADADRCAKTLTIEIGDRTYEFIKAQIIERGVEATASAIEGRAGAMLDVLVEDRIARATNDVTQKGGDK